MNIPNLLVDYNQIVAFRSSIISSIPYYFEHFVTDCFKLKPSQDCETLFLEDFSKWDGRKLPYDVSIVVSLTKKNDCECIPICSGLTMEPNSKLVFENLIKDGTYAVNIVVTYTVDVPIQGMITFTKVICKSYVKDCCKREYKEVANNIWEKMSGIACTITNFSETGRTVKSLKKSYIALSNLLWVYYHAADSCLEVDKIKCLYTKIR